MDDAAARRRALDPAGSFIVQAPAGSGKTELLTQRFLVLLGRASVPEEIVAITFTNKAAGEMRGRVLGALRRADDGTVPEKSHERKTWELARAARLRDRECGWDIQANPGRLRVHTIDALCAALTRQMPWLSRLGAQTGVVEDARELYTQAARNTLAELESGAGWSLAVERLLGHLDNNLGRVEGLLAAMLGRRDQWLRHVVGAGVQRRALEQALERVIRDELTLLRREFPPGPVAELCLLAGYAVENLETAGRDPAILACRDIRELPGAAAGDLERWRGLAALLLTAGGDWRKSVSVATGFPPSGGARSAAEKARRGEMKQRMRAVLADLGEEDTLREALEGARGLPPAGFGDRQWAVIEALFTLLPMAEAQLRLVFRERGLVDFTAVSQAALTALGEPEGPTDLALALDYRISHLLVDEFQDTSQSQYQLLERLTAGWELGDGRTLFVVGDPMQSIYRFREAEVGLYLRARGAGVGQVQLVPLVLNVNFRSQEGIVAWVNHAFSKVFPREEDIGAGAVPYVESVAEHPRLSGVAVGVHPFLGKQPGEEAQAVVRLVREERGRNPDGTLAILVRGRSHLWEIIPHLKRAGVRFRAIEIERLGHRQPVQDLLALTRALLHPADRTAWLAVLRAPWAGLSLADLHALAEGDFSAALWDLLTDEGRKQRLSRDGRERLDRVLEVVGISLSQRRRRSLRRWVEGTWLALGGPACQENETDLNDIRVFFDLLDRLEVAGDLQDPTVLGEKVAELFALPDVGADDRVQIMTIHKAKGLEFDTVILPGLGRPPRPDDPRLLLWMERPLADGEGTDLLLAPIRAAGEEQEPIYAYLQGLGRKKAELEDGRLLYVAITRARARLHLLGHTGYREDDGGFRLLRPSRQSMLARLWPVVEEDFRRIAGPAGGGGNAAVASDQADGQVAPHQGIRRLATGWVSPGPPAPVGWRTSGMPEMEMDTEVEFLWARETIRHVGSVVHKMLQRIAADGLNAWDRSRLNTLDGQISRLLSHAGVPPSQLDGAVTRVRKALDRTLGDERGRWLLGEHTEACCEYPISGVRHGRVVHVVIDRTFVDGRGVRWVIDYKTSTHEGAERESFLDNERERYRGQLETYGLLMAKLDARPVRLGLYFPLLNGWREWEYIK